MWKPGNGEEGITQNGSNCWINFLDSGFQINRNLMRGRFGAAQQEILNDRIIALLQLRRRAIEIDPSFVQVGNAIANLHRALHVVRDDNARHLKSLLQIDG